MFTFVGRMKDVRSSSKFGWTVHYRCVSYCPSVDGKRCGCKARIKIRHSDGKARAVENTSISAQIIADTIADEYDVRYVGRLATFLSRQQLKKAVYNARAEEFASSLLYLCIYCSNCLNNIIVTICYCECIHLPIVATSELYV